MTDTLEALHRAPFGPWQPHLDGYDEHAARSIQFGDLTHGPRLWCPCHGEGGTYYAKIEGYHYSQDRSGSFPCPRAREVKK